MKGLLLKTLRETWLTALAFGLGLLGAERLVMFVLPQIQGQIDQLLAALPFVRSLVGPLMGIDPNQPFGLSMIQALAWVHPVVLSLVWGCEIVLCTRTPAGEIDRGTMDVLLGLPVSRRMVFWSESAGWMAAGAVVIGLGTTGYLMGAAAMDPAQRAPAAAVWLVVVNLAAMYVAVGGTTFLVSAMCSRRARAIAIAFGIVLASFLLNFLAQTWEPARRLAFLGLLEYYQPARVLDTGRLPFGDVAVLLAVGTAAWIAAGEVMARRAMTTT